MSNCKTYQIDANNTFLSDGGATLAGFIATGSRNENVLATVSGWKPDGGSHPTCLFVKTVEEGGKAGIWFRANFVNNAPNGSIWITMFQSGAPVWPASAQATRIAFNSAPWH